MSVRHVDAILLIYHHPLVRNAPTIMEHVNSFEKYSRFPVIKVNTECGLDPRLRDLRFPVVVFHYSLFGCEHYLIDEPWYEYFETLHDSYKIAFFQDDYHGCQKRFAFLNTWNIDCVYSLYDPRYWDQVYRPHTTVSKIRPTLTGYVDEIALDYRRRWVQPGRKRPIDVGYRARKLPFYMGAGGQEKWWVARDFLTHAAPLGLKTDISWHEEDRIYGAAWYKFVASCNGMLGAEAGVSISDLDGEFIKKYRALMAAEPNLTFEEVTEKLLRHYENNIPERVMSPRCFEAAALNTCQILLEGDYNGILVPWRHYLPLKRDFSNFDEVMRAFADPAMRGSIVETAFQDLVASGKYSYRTFIQGFDQALVEDTGWGVSQAAITERELQTEFYNRQRWRLKRKLAKAVAMQGASRLLKLSGFAVRRFPFSWRQRVRKILGLPVREHP